MIFPSDPSHLSYHPDLFKAKVSKSAAGALIRRKKIMVSLLICFKINLKLEPLRVHEARDFVRTVGNVYGEAKVS